MFSVSWIAGVPSTIFCGPLFWEGERLPRVRRPGWLVCLILAGKGTCCPYRLLHPPSARCLLSHRCLEQGQGHLPQGEIWLSEQWTFFEEIGKEVDGCWNLGATNFLSFRKKKVPVHSSDVRCLIFCVPCALSYIPGLCQLWGLIFEILTPRNGVALLRAQTRSQQHWDSYIWLNHPHY